MMMRPPRSLRNQAVPLLLFKFKKASGKTNEYGYDELNRLTSETVTVNGISTETAYTFDAVGNRLTKKNICTYGDLTPTDDPLMSERRRYGCK